MWSGGKKQGEGLQFYWDRKAKNGEEGEQSAFAAAAAAAAATASGGGCGAHDGGVERQLLTFGLFFEKDYSYTFRAIFHNRMLVLKKATLHSCCSREPAILDDSGLTHRDVKRRRMGSKGERRGL
jgi:hypothetical protein